MATDKTSSESAIRALIEKWATAVYAGDLEGVLADDSKDIQMFDLPPPNEVRGIGTHAGTTTTAPRPDEAGSE